MTQLTETQQRVSNALADVFKQARDMAAGSPELIKPKAIPAIDYRDLARQEREHAKFIEDNPEIYGTFMSVREGGKHRVMAAKYDRIADGLEANQ